MKKTEKFYSIVCDACGKDIKKTDARVQIHEPGNVKEKKAPKTFDYHKACVEVSIALPKPELKAEV